MNIMDWFKTLLVPEQASTHTSGRPAASPLPEFEGSAELAGLDFQAAIRAHHAWKERLDALLQERSREQMDPVAICRDDLCELGQWIHGGGRRVFGHLDVFEDLRRHHADFHLVAAEVVNLVAREAYLAAVGKVKTPVLLQKLLPATLAVMSSSRAAR